MPQSQIEQLICSKDFVYWHPYFYSNPYALRCELGIGDEDYMENAKKRAIEIYQILFPQGADAIFFNHYVGDYARSGEAEKNDFDQDDDIDGVLENTIEREADSLRFLLKHQLEYRHIAVKDLPPYDENSQRRHRIVCFSDGKAFDYNELIDRQIEVEFACDISFVSFENECILSIYDDRGCDIVFATHEKLREFYHSLKPYFLEYDAVEMEKRYNG